MSIASHDSLGDLQQLARRFQGITLKFRRGAPSRWVATNHCSKNERAMYRLTVEAETVERAIEKLLAAVANVDREQQL